MNFLKKSMLLFPFFLSISCASTKFGLSNNDFIYFNNRDEKRVREITVPYSSFIHGIPVKGEKTDILGSAVSPDGKKLFIIVNFPKFAILSTDDGGTTFNSSVFDTSYFNIPEESSDGRKTGLKPRKDIRVISAFYEDKIAISVGPFVFTSSDEGRSWKRHSLFFDLDGSFIRNMNVMDGLLFVFTDNRIAYSDDWDRKWTRLRPETESLRNRNIQFVDSIIYNDRLYLSYLDKTADLRGNSLYSMKENNFGRIFTFSSNALNETDMKTAGGFFVSDDKLYIYSPFKTRLSDFNFDAGFKKTSLYKDLNMAGQKNSVRYFAEEVLKSYYDNDLFYPAAVIVDDSLEYAEVDEKINRAVINNIAAVRSRLSSFLNDRASSNFYFSNDPEEMFYSLTGGFIDYLKCSFSGGDGAEYVIMPDRNFVLSVFEDVLNKKYERENTPVFLRRVPYGLNVDFIRASKYFPFAVLSAGDSLSHIVSTEEFVKAINPGEKQRSFYWYNNIDRKKRFRLEFVIGADEKLDMLYYPGKIFMYNGDIVVEIVYFNDVRSYRELYRIKID